MPHYAAIDRAPPHEPGSRGFTQDFGAAPSLQGPQNHPGHRRRLVLVPFPVGHPRSTSVLCPRSRKSAGERPLLPNGFPRSPKTFHGRSASLAQPPPSQLRPSRSRNAHSPAETCTGYEECSRKRATWAVGWPSTPPGGLGAITSQESGSPRPPASTARCHWACLHREIRHGYSAVAPENG